MDSQGSAAMGCHVETAVVVVGAGYAGLSAALALHDRGVEVLVLEAGARVGGRTLSAIDDAGVVIDHGGQWIGPTQHDFYALVKRFGAPTFPTYLAGHNIELWRDGVQRHFQVAGPDGAPGMPEYLAAMEHIDRLALAVNLDDPALTPGAEAMDSETVHSFLERTVPSADARLRFRLAVQSVWTVEPRDISLLHFLFYIASAGGFEQLMEAEGCAQETRFERGAQSIALDIASVLGPRVHLNQPVRAVTQTEQGVTVETGTLTVHAARVIVATPPPATAQIVFRPELPVPRRRWLAKSPMGDVIKIHVSYDTPFWRSRDLSGEATIYDDSALGFVFDNSPHDARRGVLVCFIYADKIARWRALPAPDRREEVLAKLVELFGSDARACVDYVEKDWAVEPFIGGAYAANPTPGAWVEHGQAGWRAATGAIHWAGTETASRWNGYIDGAVSSGRRAAEEVLELL
ncbi:flavin monoamine oxidase family protein [Leucobacter sp. HY1908]